MAKTHIPLELCPSTKKRCAITRSAYGCAGAVSNVASACRARRCVAYSKAKNKCDPTAENVCPKCPLAKSRSSNPVKKGKKK